MAAVRETEAGDKRSVEWVKEAAGGEELSRLQQRDEAGES